MTSFCPIIRERCKENECLAWKDSACLVFSFLALAVKPLDEPLASQSSSVDDDREEKRKGVPSDIGAATAEGLAAELVRFAKEELAGSDEVWIADVSDAYWEKKGIEKWEAPAAVRLKLDKAERLAQQKIRDEKAAEEKIRVDREKAELPDLTQRCLKWALENGLKRITHSDITAFLMAEGAELSYETERALYSKANVQLKSQHK